MKKIYQRISEIKARIRQLADTLETEKREKTEEETREIKALERELDILEMRRRAYDLPDEKKAKTITLKDCFRTVADLGMKDTRFVITRDGTTSTVPMVNTALKHDLENVMLTTDLSDSALIPLKVGDIIKPLHEDLVYKKIGIQLPTGCVGNYEWPVVEAIEAEIAGEGEAIDATKIDLSSINAVTQRIAVGVSATREALWQSDGKLEGIIRELMPLAIAEKVNKILLSTEKVNEKCAITGPFVGKSAKAIPFTFKDFNKAKADLLKKNYTTAGLVWIMTESTKAELEATPKDPGSGIMLVENDRLCGLPVFCTEHIGEGNVGIGDFRQQVCGQFGDFYLTVDWSTGASANMVKIWLNTLFGTATLRPDAFALYKEKTA